MTNIIHWRKTNFFQVFFKIQVTIKKKQWFESSICFWIKKRVLNLDIVIYSHKRPQTEEKWVRKDRNKSCHHFSRTDLQTSECDVWSEVSNRTDRWVSTPDPDSQVKGTCLIKNIWGFDSWLCPFQSETCGLNSLAYWSEWWRFKSQHCLCCVFERAPLPCLLQECWTLTDLILWLKLPNKLEMWRNCHVCVINKGFVTSGCITHAQG